MRKVLYFINAFNKGGAEKGLLNLVEKGAFAGCELRVAAITKGEGIYIEELRRRGVSLDVFSQSETMTSTAWLNSLPRLRAYIRRFKPDVMILSLPQANIVGRIAALTAPGLTVASFEHNTHLAKPIYERLFRLTSKRVDWLIADSQVTADVVGRRLYNHQPTETFVLPLVSFGALPPAQSSRPPDAAAPFVIANAGRFTKVKNQTALIEAVAALRRRGREVRLNLYGDGPLMEDCRKRANELGVGEQVAFLGFRGDWMKQPADCFALASLHEGLCIVALEAMGEGMPVVATRTGGLVDYGPPAKAILLDDPAPDKLAESIETLIENPDQRAEMGEAGRQAVRDRFSDEAIEEVYRRFASNLQVADRRRS